MDKGLLHQALCEALRKQLQGYYEVLSQLMSSEGTKRLPKAFKTSMKSNEIFIFSLKFILIRFKITKS